MFRKLRRTHTPKLHPLLGLFGFLGLLGFMGFFPQGFAATKAVRVPFPLLYFGFFGFFGFYYSGKLSGTLIDERFEANENRASAIANRTALVIILFVSVFTTSIYLTDVDKLLRILITTISIAWGLAVFLGQYLLYHFETEE